MVVVMAVVVTGGAVKVTWESLRSVVCWSHRSQSCAAAVWLHVAKRSHLGRSGVPHFAAATVSRQFVEK
jgi:hypothetical protein